MVAPRGKASEPSAILDEVTGEPMPWEDTLAAVPTPLVLTDVDGAIEFANAAFADLLRSSAADLAGRPVLGLVQPQDRGLLARKVTALLAQRPSVDLLLRLQADGRTVPVLAGAVVVSFTADVTRILWMMVRPGLLDADPGPADVTAMALDLSRFAASPSADIEPTWLVGHGPS